MKRYCLLAFLVFSFIAGFAQNISVKSFRALPTDMTASSKDGKRIDQNGEVAALIKVVTSETGFTFEGGTLGIVDAKQRNGEIWVWVPHGLRKITVLHQQLGVLRDYRFPIEIEAERTYEMVLTTAKIETIVKEEVRQQYLVFQIKPVNATLEVNDELWSVDADGMASQYVHFGTYTYRVRASNYFIEAGNVTVNDPDNATMVKVSLKPDFAEVTLKVDADAEIWVNNEKKGIRTWTGPMGKGIYKIECRQTGYETTATSKEITREIDGHIIVLEAPKPVYGSLQVESTPNLCKLFIDGKEVGTTPKSINEILMGQHVIKLTKEGYNNYVDTVTIVKNERKQVKATLVVGTDHPSESSELEDLFTAETAKTPQDIVAQMNVVMKRNRRNNGFSMTFDVRAPLLGSFITGQSLVLGDKSRVSVSYSDGPSISWRDGKKTWLYDTSKNEIETQGLTYEFWYEGTLDLLDDFNGYNVSIKKETAETWQLNYKKTKENTDEGAPNKMELVVSKATFMPVSISTKNLILQDFKLGVTEEQVTFDPAKYPNATIVEKRW